MTKQTTIRKSLKAADFNVGDKFIIKSGGYGKYHFEVIQVNADSIWFVNGHDDQSYTIADVNLAVYGPDVQIVKRSEDSFRKVYAQKVLGQDEQTATKWDAALHRAQTELETNPTISFRGGILSFISSRSGKQRFVTKFGCTKKCDCRGEISYHRALYELLAARGVPVTAKLVHIQKKGLAETLAA